MILTQSAEKTFRTCKRLFRHRHIDHLAWPEYVPGFEDRRERLERGSQFHLLVKRALEGRPITTVPDDIAVPYNRWKVLQFPPQARKLPELELSYPHTRLVKGETKTDILQARLDLLVLDSSTRNVTVFDWKLGTAPNDAAALRQDPQTIWYLFLVGAVWPRVRTIYPEFAEIEDISDRLSMTYWFAQPKKASATSHTIQYSSEQFARDRLTVEAAVESMVDRPYDEYVQTDDLALCAACQYRSLCQRAPGPLQRIEEEVADLIAWDLDLDATDASEDFVTNEGR